MNVVLLFNSNSSSIMIEFEPKDFLNLWVAIRSNDYVFATVL